MRVPLSAAAFVVAVIVLGGWCPVPGQALDAHCEQLKKKYESGFLDIGTPMSAVEMLWGKPTRTERGAHQGHDLYGYALGGCYFWIEVFSDGPRLRAYKYEFRGGSLGEPASAAQPRTVLIAKPSAEPAPVPEDQAPPPSFVAEQRSTLAGLKSVGVLIERLQADAEALGLSTDALQTDVELRLRRSGIRVLTNAEMKHDPGAPYLYLGVNFQCSADLPLCAQSINLQFTQSVILSRDPTIESFGSTWDKNVVGMIGRKVFASSTRQAVGDLVDQFLNDFLTVNPK